MVKFIRGQSYYRDEKGEMRMNLEELKNSLNTEAYTKSIEQEKLIIGLNKIISEYLKTIEKQKTCIKQLQGRCFVHHNGILCPFCGFKNDCVKRGKQSE